MSCEYGMHFKNSLTFIKARKSNLNTLHIMSTFVNKCCPKAADQQIKVKVMVWHNFWDRSKHKSVT